MNKLNPLLKRLLVEADKAERAADGNDLPEPTREFIERVVRGSRGTAAAETAEPSLLFEFMVQRAAALAVVIGLLSLAFQYAPTRPPMGVFGPAITHGVVLVRAFLP